MTYLAASRVSRDAKSIFVRLSISSKARDSTFAACNCFNILIEIFFFGLKLCLSESLSEIFEVIVYCDPDSSSFIFEREKQFLKNRKNLI